MTRQVPKYGHIPVTISDVINYLEQKVQLQKHNALATAGILVGDVRNAVTGILISLGITEEVLDEALEKECNFIVVNQFFFLVH